MQKRVITGLLASAYVITMILLGKTALVINVVLLLLVGTYEILQSLRRAGSARSSGCIIRMCFCWCPPTSGAGTGGCCSCS